MPNRRECSTAASVRELRSKQTTTSGGSSDSEATALAVIPDGPSGPKLVIAVTPVAKRPQTSRKVWGSTAAMGILDQQSSGKDEPGAGSFAAVLADAAPPNPEVSRVRGSP